MNFILKILLISILFCNFVADNSFAEESNFFNLFRPDNLDILGKKKEPEQLQSKDKAQNKTVRVKEKPNQKKTETEIQEKKNESSIGVADFFSKPIYEKERPDIPFKITPAKPEVEISDILKEKNKPTILDKDYPKISSIAKKPKLPDYILRQSDRRLKMVNLHTNERINITYWRNGDYINSALKKINYFLRDHRSGEVISYDIEVLNLLDRIIKKLNYRGEIQIISGYRSLKTQRMFRKQGRNVAKKSQHSYGKAIDFRLPGISTRRLRDVAKSFKKGGVGYYPRDRFVHIDTASVRYW
jgi:uncharacterized protein YcbK (DUF882 family)